MLILAILRDVQFQKMGCAEKVILIKAALQANRSVCHRIKMCQPHKIRASKEIAIKTVQDFIHMTEENIYAQNE